MAKKEFLLILIVLFVSGCISAQDLETETDIDVEELRYDLDLRADVEKNQYFEELNEHTDILNESTSLLCSSIANRNFEDTDQDRREELKPRNVNVELYNQENNMIAECEINED